MIQKLSNLSKVLADEILLSYGTYHIACILWISSRGKEYLPSGTAPQFRLLGPFCAYDVIKQDL